MRSNAAITDPFSSRAATPGGNDGYLGSSLDLRAGLSIRELRVSALPHEVVSELARMRRSWPVAVAKTALVAASLNPASA